MKLSIDADWKWYNSLSEIGLGAGFTINFKEKEFGFIITVINTMLTVEFKIK